MLGFENIAPTTMKRLSNGRTKDFDNLYGEFLKYGYEAHTSPICAVINSIFVTQTPLDAT